MRNFVFLIAAALFAVLISCASFSEPVNIDDCLVIGSIILDFPDGFFDCSPLVAKNIRLSFTNLDTNESFTKWTDNGMFSFNARGSDAYLLNGFSFERSLNGKIYNIDDPLQIEIECVSKKILYVGHIHVIYHNPEKDSKLGESTYYRYKIEINLTNNKDAVIEYIKSKNKNSTWLDYEIDDRYAE